MEKNKFQAPVPPFLFAPVNFQMNANVSGIFQPGKN
jgi:hypothetical protein